MMENPGVIPCNECELKQVSAFQACRDESLERLFGQKKTRTFAKGERLMLQGEPFDGIYCILEGSVKVFKSSGNSREVILWIEGPGELVGFDINSEEHIFTALAITEVKACFIPIQSLRSLMLEEPGFSIRLMRWLCEKIDQIENRIISVAQKKVHTQLAELLMKLAFNGKEKSNDAVINYTIHDLAAIIGTTRNYLYKVLSDLSDKDIISFENRKLRIKNAGKLSLLANGQQQDMI